MKLFLLFCTIIFLPLDLLFAKESDTVFSNFNYGIYGGLSLNFHNVKFKKLPGLKPCETCPNYTEGFGLGPNLGIDVSANFYTEYKLGLRVGYHSLFGEFENTEPTTVMVDEGSMPGEFKHYLNTRIHTIEFNPYFGWNILKKLTISAGMNFALFAKKSYDQYEKISKPEIGATFIDSNGNDTFLKTRNQLEGEISDLNKLQLFGTFRASYELPLNKENSLTLNPEAQFNYAFSDVCNSIEWKINSIHLGLAIKYYPPVVIEPIRFYKKEEKVDTVKLISENLTPRFSPKYVTGILNSRIDTLVSIDTIFFIERFSRTDTIIYSKDYNLKTFVEACGVDSNGKEIPKPLFVIEEIFTTKYHPTLNYIFFDKNSHVIPKRYKQISDEEARLYSIDSLKGISTMPVYYDVLNILGKRLQTNKNIKLNIVGFNNGLEEEKDNKKLSLNRAQSIADYFENTWKIEKKRLKVTGKNLPEKASTPIEELEKSQENQRVEIQSLAEEFDEPTSSSDVVRIVSPPVARFKTNIIADAGIKSGELKVFQKGKLLKDFRIENNSKSTFDWKMDEDQSTTPKIEDSLEYEIEIIDAKEQTVKSELKKLAIEQLTIKKKRIEKIADSEFEKFSLILFDFDSDKLNSSNIEVIKSIRAKIQDNSKVKIVGYTDRTGESEHNKNLSLKRAEAVYKALGIKDAIVEGAGSEIVLFDNDTPEGRVFSRTVEITIETPVSYK